MKFLQALGVAVLIWIALGLQVAADVGQERVVVPGKFIDIVSCKHGIEMACPTRMDKVGEPVIVPMMAAGAQSSDDGPVMQASDDAAIMPSTISAPLPVPAGKPWSLEELNDAVNSAMWIVEDRCSGTLVSFSGGRARVLTNYHCIQHLVTTREREEVNEDGIVEKVKREHTEFARISQKAYNQDAVSVGLASYTTKIVAHQKDRDLALLELMSEIPNKIAFKILPEGENVQRGQRVYAVGNPRLLDGSMTTGIISSVHRRYEFSWTGFEPLQMLQFSAQISGGSSGGALLDERGYQIGVPSAGYRGDSYLNLAIPAKIIRKFLRDHCHASVYDATADDDKCRADKKAKAEAKKK